MDGMMKQGIDKQRSTLVVVLIAAVIWTCSSGLMATEVYTWTDENGVKHFSDSKPQSGESETLQVEEVYRPGTTGAYPVSTESAVTPAGVSPGETPEEPLSAAEERRQNLALERDKRRTAQAENDILCAQHRQVVEQMEPHRRVFYTDENGETVRMDDVKRVNAVQESKDFIAKNCK